MINTFIAEVRQTKDMFVIESNAVVHRQDMDNASVLVAHIHDFYGIADHRKTRIRFAQGVLEFSAAYDGPMLDRFDWDFSHEQRGGAHISLHSFPWAKQYYLSSSEGLFPIGLKKNGDAFKIVVYQPTPVPKEDGLLYPVLASILQTQKHEGGFEYRIQVEKLVPDAFLAVIFSLPFTIPYIID